MSPRGVIPLARPSTSTLARRLPEAPRRRRALALASMLLGLVGAGVVAPIGGVHASTVVQPTVSGARILSDPQSTVKVEVTPGDSSTWNQGDIIHFHVSGMTRGTALATLGTCPGDLPAVGERPGGRKHEINPASLSLACQNRLPTAIPGGVDLTGDTPALSSSLTNVFARPDGTLDVDFRIGMGEQVGTNGPLYIYNGGVPLREVKDKVTCSATAPCVVGFNVLRTDGSYFTDVTDLRIAPAAKTGFDAGSCTGLSATQTLTASGPERMQTPLSALDRGFCGTKSSPIPVSFLSSEVGEAGPTGTATVGTSADLAFVGSPALTATPLAAGQVAVPIAINATAVAQMGGISSRSTDPTQFAYNPTDLSTIHLDPSDVAGIVLHDYTTAPYDANTAPASFNPLGDRIAGRPGNIQLSGFDPGHGGLPFTQVTTPTYGVGPSSLAVSLSGYLSSRAGGAWAYPDNAINQKLKRAGRPVGSLTSFDPVVDHSDAAPHLTSQMSSINSIYSVMATKDSPNFTVYEGQTSACPLSSTPGSNTSFRWAQDGCVRFAVLDAASAASVGLTTASLGSGTSASDYVAPSTGSMQTAATAAAGRLGAKGYFETTAGDAYPMTFVEYAVVSTNALVDDACAPRTAQQQMLKDFLGYATTAGQSALPAGLAGLTPELATQAAAAVSRIGTTTVARCVRKAPVPPGATPTPAPVVTPAPQPPVDTTNGGGGDTSGSVGGGSSGTGTGAGTATTDTGGVGTTEASGALASNAKEKPVILGSKQLALQDATFSGASRTSPVSAVVGLLVLLLLVGVGAAWAAGALALPGLGQRVPSAAPTTGGAR